MKFLIKEKNGSKIFNKESDSKNEAIIETFNDFFEIEKVENSNEIPLDYYWQRNPRYKGIKLGFSENSFQNFGCFTCCLAYLVKKDPLEVHELLKKEKCYNNDLIISDKTAKVLGLELQKGNSNITGKHTDPNLNPQFETIKEVKLGKSQHFVVRLIDEKGKTSIFDPWNVKVLPVNYYKFVSFRLFKKNHLPDIGKTINN